MHQAVKAFLANRRQGTAKTKTRGEVTGGNQKPWKQKGTGRARQGSTRAPNWPGGGTVFVPQPLRYTQIGPKQVRALARKSALNARARENAVLLVDALDYRAPKTKAMLSLFDSLGVAGKKVGRPCTMRPTDSGWKPSTSFPTATVSITLCSEMCRGNGSCTRIPSMPSSSLNDEIFERSSLSETSSGSLSRVDRKPISSQDLTFDAT
jgi:hypothetical protein